MAPLTSHVSLGQVSKRMCVRVMIVIACKVKVARPLWHRARKATRKGNICLELDWRLLMVFKIFIWTKGLCLSCAFCVHVISSALKILIIIYKCNALTSLLKETEQHHPFKTGHNITFKTIN